MSQSDYFQTIQTQYGPQIRARVLEGARAQEFLASHRQSFRGSLQLGELDFSLPEQDFSFHLTKTGGYLKNHPKSHWPKIRIDFVFSSDEPLETGNFQVVSADKTVEAGLLATRVLLTIMAAGKCYLRDETGNVILGIVISKRALQENEDLLFQAKLFRKLKFIEEFFSTRFTLPDKYTSKDTENIEIVFRGITEGEFRSRINDITFHYMPSESDLDKAPFTKPGPISRTFNDPNLVIFGIKIEVGPVTIHLDRAGVINPPSVNRLRKSKQQSIDLSLIVFDLQIKYRFERYVSRPRQSLRRKLEQFRMKLRREEPAELVDLLADNLIMDVSAERARQIITGWLQFYRFPDRFCPQEPQLEGSYWRVPIWVTYPHGQGGWVQDALVDIKTGIVTVPVSVEELRNSGKSIAAEILRAS